MIRILKKLSLVLLLAPILYFLIALLLTYITVNNTNETIEEQEDMSIYIKTNGVYLDLILPNNSFEFLNLDCAYLAIGWGDKDFYLNTPTFSDLEVKTAFNALFLESPTLLHITKYQIPQNDWVEIQVSQEKLKEIKDMITTYFNPQNLKAIQGYGSSDFFYEAKGSNSCFFTCNSWVNYILKKAKVKSCL